MVDAARRDVDRNVADDADAALPGVAAQRAPLAVKADLVGERPPAAEVFPVDGPECLAFAELDQLFAAHGAPTRLLAEQPWPCRERRTRLVWGAVSIGWSEWQHLPPRLTRGGEPVDEAVRISIQTPTGK